jgi:NADH-quinone oxidoreductase subunit J
MEPLLFWAFAVLAVLGAALVVLLANPVRGAMCLVGTLFCLAVLLVLLDAHLIAVLEVLVYAGAVMVLFLFVIMLLNLREEELGARRFTLVKIGGFFACGWVGFLLGGLLIGKGDRAAVGSGYGGVAAVGKLLLTEYLLAFELTSVLLLVAIVGAVFLAKRRI